MSNINEDLQLTIKDVNKEEIKDLSYQLNLLDGTSSLTTEKINGKLEAIHIQSDQPVNVDITFMNHTLLKLQSFQGIQHFIVRQQPVDFDGRALSFAVEKIALNDPLMIKVVGVPNSTVNFIIRYC